MFKNFKEKTFTEKAARILAIPAVLVTTALGVKELLSPDKEDQKKSIQNSGNNSTIINGNGNTYNNNVYKIVDSNSKTKATELDENLKTDFYPKVNSNDDGKIKITILPFENISTVKEYEWLSKGIPETLLTSISNDTKYVVLEGNLRDKVLNEIEFQQGKYVDIKSAVRIGKLIGANEIIIGSYQISNERIKIVSRTVDVQSGKIIPNSTIEYEDYLSEPFKMQKNYSNYFINKSNHNE